MRKLNIKGILPVAAVMASLYCTCDAQVYCPTNLLSLTQTIKIVGQLKKGTREKDINQFLATNNFYSGIGIGDFFAWSDVFLLTNNCNLYLDYGGDGSGSHVVSSLEAAHIESNQVDIVSIPLARLTTNGVAQMVQTNSAIEPAATP